MKVQNLIPMLAVSAITLVSVPVVAQGAYEMVVDNEAKIGLFLQNSSNSLHKTGDLVASDSNYLIRAPMTHQGWANFTQSGLPYPGPGALSIHKKWTRISDGQCVTFAEWMTNTCNIATGDYIRGKQVIASNNPVELRGRAIARFECNGGRTYCQGQGNKWGHIMIVLAAELGLSGKVESAWVVDSNTLPSASVPYGGVIAKRKVPYEELSKFYVVTHNKNPASIACR